MGKLYNVSASPHLRSGVTTSTIMRDVAIALMPACALGVYQFGLRALLILLVSTLTCAATEYIYLRLMNRQQGPYECSAIVTGMLIGMNMPPTVPLWIPVVGSVFAILVVKQVFGGLGQNFMNPALGARCFLVISFPVIMTDFACDAYSGATPLTALKAGEIVNVFDMVVGRIPGTIGETSMVAIVFGACILIFLGIIDLRIPGSYIVTFVLFISLFGGHGFDPYFISAHLAGGGLMLGAFFMATDYVTRPVTKNGQIVFGILLGLLTGIFRIFGPGAEGVSYAIIIGNLLVPLIEKITYPKAFGKGGERV